MGDPMANGHDFDPGTGVGTCEEMGEEFEAETFGDLDRDCPHCGEPLSYVNTAKAALREVVKGRVYVDDRSEVPDDAEAQEGPKGGTYYESGDTGSVEGDNPEPSEDGVMLTELGMDVDYRDELSLPEKVELIDQVQENGERGTVDLSEAIATDPYVDEEHAASYAEEGEYEDRPIDAVRVGGETYILDGHHRAAAALMSGEEEVQARIYDADEAAKSALKSALGKEWTGPHEGEQGGTYWLNTETDERRYQEDKPSETEGGEEEAEEEQPVDGDEEAGPADDAGEPELTPQEEFEENFVEIEDGKYAEATPVENVEQLEGGDTILTADGEEFEVESVGEDARGEKRVVVEGEGDVPTVLTPNEVSGEVEGEVYDVGDYNVETEWGAKMANGVTTGDFGHQGADGFVGVRDIQHHASDIENEDLLADALLEEKESRNSESATRAMESRIRALGGDPEAMLERRGYGKVQGGDGEGDGEYPVEGYDSAEENIEDLLEEEDPVWSKQGFGGTQGKGINNKEQWEAISENASNEELAQAIADTLDTSHFDVDEEDKERLMEVANGDLDSEELPFTVKREIRLDDGASMLGGLLYYREDSGMEFNTVMMTDGDGGSANVDEDFLNSNVSQTLAQIDPTTGAALLTHTDSVVSEEIDAKGRYMSSTGKVKINTDDASTVSHELAHSLHYMMGMGGGGNWGDNDWGKPKSKEVDTPRDVLERKTGSRERPTDEGLEAAGWSPDAFDIGVDLEREWKRYQAAQLGEPQAGPPLDQVSDLEQGEQYMVDFGEGPVEVTFEGQSGDKLAFESERGTSEVPLAVVENNEVMERFGSDEDVSQIRSYQAKGLHEFFTVTFEHWTHDRQKLESRHPEMAEVYDEYFGGGRDEYEVRDALDAAQDDLEEFTEEFGIDEGTRVKWEESDGFTQNFEVDEVERVTGDGIYFEGKDGHVHYLSTNESESFEVLG